MLIYFWVWAWALVWRERLNEMRDGARVWAGPRPSAEAGPSGVNRESRVRVDQ